MRQIYNGNTKKPKPKENQVRILKIYAFCQKIQQKTSGTGKRCWCYISIYENAPTKLPHLPPKSCHFSQCFKESHNWSIAVTQFKSVSRLHVNASSPGIYGRKRPNQRVYLEPCHRNPDILERVLNWIALSNSTAGKSAPMQVIKQPEHWRTSTTKEQK